MSRLPRDQALARRFGRTVHGTSDLSKIVTKRQNPVAHLLPVGIDLDGRNAVGDRKGGDGFDDELSRRFRPGAGGQAFERGVQRLIKEPVGQVDLLSVKYPDRRR